MMQANQTYKDLDLFQSVDELANLNLGAEISQPLKFYLNNNDYFDLRTITPEKYAEIMLNEYDIPSSARALDEQLKQKGFKTTYKFSYQYKLTRKMRERISHDGYVLEYFYELCSHPNFPRQAEYSPQFNQGMLNAASVTYWYAQYIWTYNPNTYDFKSLNPAKDWYQILNFIIGAGFEFHPLDIQYHKNVFASGHLRNQAKYEEQIKFKKWCKTEHDIDTGCLVFSDTNMEKLRKILTHQDTPYWKQIIEKYLNKIVGR